jgi:hypothetical protein
MKNDHPTTVTVAPPISYRHLFALTDDTGILQHAKYTVPDREHGYCTDDNARALIVACRGLAHGPDPELERRLPIYLSFLMHAFNRPYGRFRNFMTFDRKWTEEVGSEDSHGRAIWALGVAGVSAPLPSQRELAVRMLEESLPALDSLSSPRAWAYAILGLDHYLGCRRNDFAAYRLMTVLAERLYGQFACNAGEGWPWCEDSLTYSNAKLPYALMLAGVRLRDEEMCSVAVQALAWLITEQTAQGGHLSLIGNDGWYVRGGERARFDQQPLDAMGLTLACASAHGILGDELWRQRAMTAFGWFLGGNDIGIPLYDPASGGCCDGLHSYGVNANQGAESTLAWLIARLRIGELLGEPRSTQHARTGINTNA